MLRLGALTCGWLADTSAILPLSPSARAARAATLGKLDWVAIEASGLRFVSQRPAGGAELLGEGVLTDAEVGGWLRSIGDETSAGRPAVQLIAILGKLMIHEMPESVMLGRSQATCRCLCFRGPF